MGQEIVYCYKCQRRIVGTEFAKGQAFQVGNRISCASCAVDLLQTLPPREREQLLAKMFKSTQERQSASSASIDAPAPARDPHKSSVRILARPPARSGPPLLAVAGGVAVVVLVLLALLLSGGGKPRSEPADEDAPAPTKPAPQATAPEVRPDDVLPRRNEALQKDWADLEEKIRAHLAEDRYPGALDLLQSSRSRYALPEWTQPLDRRIGEIHAITARRFHALKEEARAAKERGALDEISPLRERAARWANPRLLAEFDSALAAVVVAPKPAPEPAPPARPAPSAAEAAALARWESAVSRASARDYPAAAEELSRAGAEAAADLEAIRSAGAVLKEAQELISKWPRGQNLSLESFNVAGGLERVEGACLRLDGARLAIKQTAGVRELELGEITPASLAELYRARAARKPDSDDRAAALFCLLEGDPDAARAVLGDKRDRVPEKYWTYAAKLADARRTEAKEVEARELFRALEDSLQDYAQAGAAVEACRKLLKDYSMTAVVVRNRASITSRTGGSREYLFCSGNLKAAGDWKSAKNAKAETYWTCEKDGDPAKPPENALDLVFTAFPENDYRCWVYAGACCQETFSFSVQGSEMTLANPKAPKDLQAAEPGSAIFAPVKLSLVGLKKTHAAHGGPKHPARWEWIPVPLPKYAAPGVKTVRLLTDQRGFSVSSAAISSQRKAPPRDADLKEFEIRWKELAAREPAIAAPAAPARSGRVVCSENFAKGRGTFGPAGEIVDAGPGGLKAVAIPPKGVGVGGFSVETKPGTVVRFRVQALIDLDAFEVISWVQAKNANCWYHIRDLKKGEWRTVEFKLGEMCWDYAGAHVMGATLDGLSFYYVNRPDDARVLLTDFEIRD